MKRRKVGELFTVIIPDEEAGKPSRRVRLFWDARGRLMVRLKGLLLGEHNFIVLTRKQAGRIVSDIHRCLVANENYYYQATYLHYPVAISSDWVRVGFRQVSLRTALRLMRQRPIYQKQRTNTCPKHTYCRRSK